MKLLILALDAMAPNVLFKHLDKFPTFKKLTEQGAYGELETVLLPIKEYLKEGLTLKKAKEEKRGYASIGCWYSLYTGLHPTTLNIKDEYIRSISKGKINFKWGSHTPYIENKNIFLWNKLNKNNLSFGVVNGFFISPEPINGFIWSGGGSDIPNLYYPSNLKEITPEYNFKRDEPKNVEELGIIKLSTKIGSSGFNKKDLEKLRNAKDKLLKKIPARYWGNKLEQIKYEKRYYLDAIKKIFSKIKTDVLMFFTLNLDSIQHFQWHEKGIKTIIEAYQEYDKFCAELIKKYNPENILVVSDHGAEPYTNSKAMKDYYIKINDELVITGETPWLAVVSGKHSLTGVFILKGPKIKNNFKVENAKLLDIHPTLLKALDINSSEKTEGKVLSQIFK